MPGTGRVRGPGALKQGATFGTLPQMGRRTLGRRIGGVLLILVLAASTAAACYRLASNTAGALVATAKRTSLDTAAILALSAGAWIENDRVESLRRAATLMLSGTPVYICVIYGGITQACVYEAGFDDLNAALRTVDNGSADLVRHSGVPILLAATDLPGPATGRVKIGLDASPLLREIRGVRARIAGVGGAVWVLASIGGLALWRFLVRRGRQDVEGEGLPPPRGEDVQGIQVDPVMKTVHVAGTPIELTRKPFDLLSLLASEDGRVFSEEDILEQVWPEAQYADSGDVRQCIYMLRKRLDVMCPGAARCIVNVKGFGYKLDAAYIRAFHTEAER